MLKLNKNKEKLTENENWSQTLKQNSILAYQDFVYNFPNSKYTNIAQTYLEKLNNELKERNQK